MFETLDDIGGYSGQPPNFRLTCILIVIEGVEINFLGYNQVRKRGEAR
jgi:hypothetical protein